MTIAVEPKMGTKELICTPSVSEMHIRLSACFDRIISVAGKVPKIETILFPELECEEFLFPVFREEEEVHKSIFSGWK